MKIIAPSFLITLLAGSALAQQCAPSPELGFDDGCGCGKAAALRERFLAGLPICETPGYAAREALTDTDVLSNEVDIEVFPSTSVITGSNTMRVRSLVNGLTQFTFRLRSNYTVTSAVLNGAIGVTPTTPPANNSSYGRTVTLDHVYNAGEEFTLRVDYTGTAVSVGFGSIAFGTEPNSSNPIIASLSEAYYAGTWWPCKDGDVLQPGDNSDKATLRLSVTAPNNLRTVSNGLLQSTTDLPNSRRKYTWTSDYPTATYLVFFSTGVYSTWSRIYTYPLDGGGTGSMPVEFNIYPGSNNTNNRNAWEKCLDMLAAYRGVYGEYPFVNEKYGIYQFPFGGGMEHQTNTGQGTFSESVTAHELGHQWWGDNVTCKTWRDIWLNEGFATYTEAIWEERKPGSTGTPALLAAMAARRPSAVNDSVYVYDASNMNRIFSSTFTYRKGGWVLHMLRHAVGDAAFFNSLAQYRGAYQGSGATTDDFAAVCSATCGKDLTRFFQQWVYGIGAPAYAWGWQNATIDGRNYLRVSLRQTQDSTWPGGGAAGSYFEMPVDLRVDSAQGSSTTVLNNGAREQWFLVPVQQTVTDTALDEFDWILDTDKVSEAYVPGPARIVSASPAPGSSVPASSVSQVAMSFSEPALSPSNNYASGVTITGPSGAVPFSATVTTPDSGARLTLSFAQTLDPGTYTVTVSDSIQNASGAALDGEMVTGLPSGNGIAGGSATWTFVVEGCATDYNQDGGSDLADAFDLANDIAAGSSSFPGSNPDFNNDGVADFSDVLDIANAIASGGC